MDDMIDGWMTMMDDDDIGGSSGKEKREL